MPVVRKRGIIEPLTNALVKKRFSLKTLVLPLGVLPWLVCVISARGQNPSIQNIGINQPVLVVLAKYLETEDPILDAEVYADAMNLKVKDFYNEASRGLTSFDFQPYEDVIELPYTYESTEPFSESYSIFDDPEVIDREVRDVIGMIYSEDPEVFDSIERVYVIVNRVKRARARRPFNFLYTNPFRNTIRASSSLQNDPYAGFRLASPFTLSTTDTDADGDGIDDADELVGPDMIAEGQPGDTGDASDPNNWDTDGDFVPDGVEVNQWGSSPLTPNSDADAFTDWEEIVLGSDPTDPEVTPQPPDGFLSTVAHELGHQLSLPDLYKLDIGGEAVEDFPETYEFWGMMAQHRMQNFSAFSRLHVGWENPATTFESFPVPELGVIGQEFLLYPPGSGNAGGIELLGIKRPYFPEILIEARDFTGLDTTRDSLGLPAIYEPGALISITDPRYNSQGAWLRANGIPFTQIELDTQGVDEFPVEEEISSPIAASFFGPAILNYRFLIQGPKSFGEIYLDGELVDTHQAEDPADFGLIEFLGGVAVDAGAHEIEWRHVRPADSYQRTVAWLDDIELDSAPIFTSEPADASGFVGDPIQISAFLGQNNQDALTYQWFKQQGTTWFALDGETNRVLSLPSATLEDSGIYKLQASNALGLIDSRQATIHVADPVARPIANLFRLPNAEFTQLTETYAWLVDSAGLRVHTPSDLPVNVDSSLGMRVTGPVQICFARFIDTNTTLAFYIDNTLQDLQASPNAFECFDLSPGIHELRWTARRTGNTGAVSLQSLELQRPPNLIQGPISTTATVGANVSFPTVVDHSLDPADVAFQWYHNNLPVAGATSESITIPSPTLTDAGAYYLEVISPFGVIYSRTATLEVHDPATNPLQALLSSPGAVVNEGADSRWETDLGFAKSLVPAPTHVATLEPGDVYDDGNGLQLEVLAPDDPASHPQGAVTVRVSAEALQQFSDVRVVKTWLDNDQDNAFGEYAYGVDAEGIPFLIGDRVYTESTLNGESVFPPVFGDAFVTFEHQVEFLLINEGDGEARNIEGTVYILPFSLFMALDINPENRVALAQQAIASLDFEHESLVSGESVVKRVPFAPNGKFRAVVVVDRVDNEQNTRNNFEIATFNQTTTWFGSPYKPIEVELPITNLSDRTRYTEAVIQGLPRQWSARITDKTLENRKGGVLLPPDERDQFYIRINPPGPETVKPGQVEEILLNIWTDSGDAYAPMDTAALVVNLTNPTQLVLGVDAPTPEKVAIGGQLTFAPVAPETKFSEPVVGTHVIVNIVGTDGSEQRLRLETSATGEFATSIVTQADVAYAARAQYPGNMQLAPSQSELIEWGRVDEKSIHSVDIESQEIVENLRAGALIGRLTALGGEGRLTFALADPRLYPDNRFFSLRSDALHTETAFDYEQQNQVDVTIQVTDEARRVYQQTIPIKVLNDSQEDFDRDGLTEIEEDKLGLSDLDPDSDRDGASDKVEIDIGTNPTDPNETPEFSWKELRSTEFEVVERLVGDPTGRGVYIVGNHGRQEGIFYALNQQTPDVIAEATGNTALAADLGGFVYYNVKGVAPIFRIHPRDNQPTEWVSRAFAPNTEIDGIGVTPPDFNHPLIPTNRGLALYTDSRANRSFLLEFLLNTPEETRASPVNLGRERLWDELVIGSDTIYLIDHASERSPTAIGWVDNKGGINIVEFKSDDQIQPGAIYQSNLDQLWFPVGFDALNQWNAIDFDSGDLDDNINAPGDRFTHAVFDDNAQTMASNRDREPQIRWTSYVPDTPPLEIMSVGDTRVAPGSKLLVQLRNVDPQTVSVTIDALPYRNFRVSSDGLLEIVVEDETPSGEIVISSRGARVVLSSELIVQRPPTALRFSSASIPEFVGVHERIGALSVPNASQPESIRYQFADSERFPDNRLFALDGAQIIAARNLDLSGIEQVRLGATASDGRHFTLLEEFRLRVDKTPKFTQQPIGQSLRAGSNFTLQATFEPQEPSIGFQWLHNNTAIPGANNATLNLQNTQPSQSGEYQLMATCDGVDYFSEIALIEVDGIRRSGIAIAAMPETATADSSIPVEIRVTPFFDTVAWTLDEVLPLSWSASEISNNGVFDAQTNTIRWGLFFGAFNRSIHYNAIPPDGYEGLAGFRGNANFDGVRDISIAGNRTISVEKPDIPDIPLEVAVIDFEIESATGRVILRIQVNQSATLAIEKSDDLYSWQTIRELPVEAGVTEFQDRPQSGQASAFYRVMGSYR